MKRLKKIILLGATGSIGKTTLELLRLHKNEFKLIGVSANTNVKKLKKIVDEFKVKHIAISNLIASKKIDFDKKLLVGEEGLNELASIKCDILVSGISGAAGLLPAITALRSGNDIAIANKEPLVIAGDFFIKETKINNTKILPVDSEHNSIFQCFDERQREKINNITLTASGGPFLNLHKKYFSKIKPSDAINHPVWSMGKKISVDSATLINKALEVIEAGYLFNLKPNQIDVLIHPQSIIHGMVHYMDGSTLANLSYPNMISPLSVALSYPERLNLGLKKLDLSKIGELTFKKPDLDKFPGLKLGWEILKQPKPYSIIMNAANEIAVELFLKNVISFNEIVDLINYALQRFEFDIPNNLEDIIDIDKRTRILIKENYRGV